MLNISPIGRSCTLEERIEFSELDKVPCAEQLETLSLGRSELCFLISMMGFEEEFSVQTWTLSVCHFRRHISLFLSLLICFPGGLCHQPLVTQAMATLLLNIPFHTRSNNSRLPCVRLHRTPFLLQVTPGPSFVVCPLCFQHALRAF